MAVTTAMKLVLAFVASSVIALVQMKPFFCRMTGVDIA
jgi:hypothetical protein